MSKASTAITKLILIIISLFLLFLLSFGQLAPGQYLEEAPLGTWNIFGLESAAALGAGFSQVVLARFNTIVLTNPALLSSLPTTNLTLNLSFNQTQMFKYWLVNTGVLTTTGNLTYRSLQINYLGLSHKGHGWTFALAYAMPENYGRPGIDYQYIYNDMLYHQLKLRQNGNLKTYALALARQVNSRLSTGLSLIWLEGYIERSLDETWRVDDIQMIDYRYQKLSGFYPVFGLNYRISDRLGLGLSLIPPYHKKAQGQSLLLIPEPNVR